MKCIRVSKSIRRTFLYMITATDTIYQRFKLRLKGRIKTFREGHLQMKFENIKHYIHEIVAVGMMTEGA